MKWTRERKREKIHELNNCAIQWFLSGFSRWINFGLTHKADKRYHFNCECENAHWTDGNGDVCCCTFIRFAIDLKCLPKERWIIIECGWFVITFMVLLRSQCSLFCFFFRLFSSKGIAYRHAHLIRLNTYRANEMNSTLNPINDAIVFGYTGSASELYINL